MKLFDGKMFSFRSLLPSATASLTAAGLGVFGKTANAAAMYKAGLNPSWSKMDDRGYQ